jgi:hypothetical protein
MTDHTKFPDKIYCNANAEDDGSDVAVYAYLTLETAADGETPVRVGVYQLVEVLETRLTVETVKVEN